MEWIFPREKITGKKIRKIMQKLLLMCCMLKTWMYILPKFQKINLNHEKKLFLNGSEHRRMELSCRQKKLLVLLRETTPKHVSDFYCWNLLNLFRTKSKLESRKKICKNKIFCGVLNPSEDTIILEFNQYWKYDNTKFIIYADLQSLNKKWDECKNNFEKSFTTKVGEHISCRYPMSTIWIFDGMENKCDVYETEDSIQKFCKPLREHAVKIINSEDLPKNAAFAKKNSNINTLMIKFIIKLKTIFLYW